jgi:hypothetical protein
VVIECEENCRVFGEDQSSETDNRGGFGAGPQVDADLIASVSEVEEGGGGGKRSAEEWPLPCTDCLVRFCVLARPWLRTM